MSSAETTYIAADATAAYGSPEGWMLSSLGKCVDILDSRRIPVNSDERAKRHGGIPYYGATGQVGWIDDFLFNEELLLLGEDGAPFLDKSVPISYIISGKSWVNNHAHVLRAIEGLTTNHYIKFWLDAFEFSEYVTGSTRLKLTQTAMTRIPVSLPPAHEQYRIVKQVQDLLGRVSVARTRLSRVPAILKRFRQAVLAAACSGRLTEDWRAREAELEPASELVARIAKERHLTHGQSKYSQEEESLPWMDADNRDLPEEWTFVRVRDVLHYQRSAGYGVLQPGNDDSNGVPMVRVCDVEHGIVLTAQLKRIAPEIEKQYKRTRLQGDEVLVTLVGTIGRTAVVPKEIAGANVARAIAMLPLCPHVVPQFVQYALAEPVKNAELSNLAREVARKTLNLGLLKAVQIPLPPIKEQNEIVRRVVALFSIADVIEQHVSAATDRADKLTQAILAKAFRGELVPTEAELARREGREYEPASVLLDRIKKERESHVSIKPERKRTRRSKLATAKG